MTLFRRFRSWIRDLRHREQVEARITDEIHSHIDERAADLISRCDLQPAQAQRQAKIDFGPIEIYKEETRRALGFRLLDEFQSDLSYALRQMRTARGLTLASILTLALGIGATTAVYSVVDAVVLRPLPFPDASRLVDLWTTSRQMPGRVTNSAANYRDWRAAQNSFEDMALIRHVASFNLISDNDPERIQGARVTASLFSVLGVKPLLGRTFGEDAEQSGKDNVVVLSYRLWRRRFAEDPNVIGKTVPLDGTPYIVVGVMPEGFEYPQGALPGLAPGNTFELWTPLTINPEEYQTRIGLDYLAIARLKPGVSMATAQAEMDGIAQRLAATYSVNKEYSPGVILAPLIDDTVGGVKTPLYVLLAAVIMVLLVGCANVVNLRIVRATSRRQEWTVRAALGADRARLVRQAFIETIPVVFLGGLGGLIVANGALSAVRTVLPPDMPRIENIGINLHVVAFTGAVMILAVLIAGIWPALHITTRNMAEQLRGGARSVSPNRESNRARNLLVVGQIASVMILLVGAFLLIRSFVALKSVNPGFESDHVLTMRLTIPRAKYLKDLQVAAFCTRLLDEVRQLPDVRFAGMVNRLPLAFGTQIGPLQIETGRGEKTVSDLDWRSATPDYFRAMGIPVVAGRLFNADDDTSHPMVGVIDDRVAHSVFGNESPLGKRFRIPFTGQPWIEIVGVVGHVHHDGLSLDPRGQVYWNYLQRAQDRMALVVRTDGDPNAIAASIVSRIHAVDREQPVSDVRSMNDVVDRSVSKQSLTSILAGLFAFTALVLAVVGVYGVMSYIVGQRAGEIGIRVALGASYFQILTMILRDGAVLIGAGLAMGVAGALLAQRTLKSLLYGVSSTDIVSFSGAFVLIGGIALLACYIPARRAASADPNLVLRAE